MQAPSHILLALALSIFLFLPLILAAPLDLDLNLNLPDANPNANANAEGNAEGNAGKIAEFKNARVRFLTGADSMVCHGHPACICFAGGEVCLHKE